MMSWWRHLLSKKELKLSTILDLPFWINLTYFILLTEKNRSKRDFKFDLFFPHNDLETVVNIVRIVLFKSVKGCIGRQSF